MPTIDFSEVKGIEPVPVGAYPATIVKAEETESKAGNPMIDIQWKIEAGGEHDGRIIFDSMVFTATTLWRVKQTLVALGFKKNFRGAVEAEDLVGKSANITVDIEPSTQLDEDGEPYPPRNRIKKVRPLK